MMYQPKVKNILQYESNQNEYRVTSGKLLLLERSIGLYSRLIKNNVTNHITIREGSLVYDDVGLDPIIISDEDVQGGDYVLYANSIYEVKRIDDHDRPIVISEGNECQLDSWDKILVLPQQFSKHQLLNISIGKLKEDDEVLIKLEHVTTNGTNPVGLANQFKIGLGVNNKVTLFTPTQSAKEFAKENAISEDHYQGILLGIRWANGNF